MPGQGKRKRREEAARRRVDARTAADAGRWEVVLETGDQAVLRARLRRLREERVDEALLRIDTLCRRPAEQSSYVLSRFVEGTATQEGGSVR
ncbi:hypothetical protein [Streptomyces sp. TBY4]|uniref:hypothetical protein n=1 Tax=Streptomyces sp. TBY4 TaxID=2962030 RepID=UPI0020B72FB5|nr:hypothetical protein [Streptomyces sp. TBY4]MCP3757295.1 hypothetical protein [Streptomyces sp. TBY4]